MDDLLIQEEVIVKTTDDLENIKDESSDKYNLYKKEDLILFNNETNEVKMNLDKIKDEEDADFLFIDPDGAVDHYEEVLEGQTTILNSPKDSLSVGEYHNTSNDENDEIFTPPKKKKRTSNDSDITKLGAGFTLECSFCMFTTSTEKVMKNHMLQHIYGIDLEAFVQVSRTDDAYKCLFCPFSSVSAEMFKYHLKFKHSPSKDSSTNKILKPIDQIFDSDDEDDDDEDNYAHDNIESLNYRKQNNIMLNCKNCNFQCEDINEMNEHLSEFHPSMILKCGQCSYATFNKSTFKNHLESHIDIPPFSCSTCSFSTDIKEVYLQHKAAHSDIQSYFICPECGFQAKTKKGYGKHMEKHVKNKSKLGKKKNDLKVIKPYICEECGFQCRTTQGFNKHKAKHFRKYTSILPDFSVLKTEDNTYECDECSFEAKTLQGFTKHKEKHLRESSNFPKHFFTSDNEIFGAREEEIAYSKPNDEEAPSFVGQENVFACDECSFQAKTLQGFNKHKGKHMRKRGKVSAIPIKSKLSGLFHCDECNFKTGARQAFLKHKGKHLRNLQKYSKKLKKKQNVKLIQGEKFACDECNFESKTLSGYVKHKKVHSRNSKDYPFACSYCHYKATKRSHLSRHIMIHTGEKPFACPHCDYRCNQASTLKVHVGRHSQDSALACSYCPFKSLSIGMLNAHLKKHDSQNGNGVTAVKRRKTTKKFKKEDDSISLVDELPEQPMTIPGLYQCSLCDFQCSKFVELSQHSITHKNDTKGRDKKKYFCNECNVEFLRKKEIKAHYKIAHPGINYQKNR